MLWSCLTLAALVAARPLGRGSPTTLTELTDRSTIICIGTVDRVSTVAFPDGIRASDISSTPARDLPFGRISVERMLKGDPVTKIVYHEAWTTWACDATVAAQGERAFFFLGPGVISSANDSNRLIAEAGLGSAHIYRNVGSGDGIARIGMSDAGPWIRGGPAPLSIRLSGGDDRLRLEAAADYVQTLVKFAPEACAVLAQQCGLGQHYDLRVLADGSRRFAIRFLDFERVMLDATPAGAWAVLDGSLPWIVGDRDQTMGVGYKPWTRRLELRSGGNVLRFFQNERQDPAELNKASKGAYVRALRGWGMMRDTLDCDLCGDERPGDADLIAELTRK